MLYGRPGTSFCKALWDTIRGNETEVNFHAAFYGGIQRTRLEPVFMAANRSVGDGGK